MASGARVWRTVRWLALGVAGTAILASFVAVAALDGMERVAAWYFAQLVLPAFSGLAFVGAGVYALARRRWRSPAVLVTLAVAGPVAAAAGAWALGALPVRYPATLEGTAPVARVRLPLDGPIQVGWGGDALATNYHAATPDQRWAYDLLVEPYLVGSADVHDYGCYGRDVVAPAAGVVTVARDGLPDHVPGVVSNDYANPTGNTVGLRLDETGTFLVLAHLAPGSVAVAVGAHVAEGERIGACGNSGNTSEPHVHLHRQREDPATSPVGFAEGLPLYFRDHEGPAMPVGGLEEVEGTLRATGDVVQHRGR